MYVARAVGGAPFRSREGAKESHHSSRGRSIMWQAPSIVLPAVFGGGSQGEPSKTLSLEGMAGSLPEGSRENAPHCFSGFLHS